MTKKYILTGGPGSGKSSIILDLESRGEYVVREAAEDVIKRFQADGIEKPWEEPDFQERILDLQVQRERAIPSTIERAFIDRGVLDGLAYTKEGTNTYEKIQRRKEYYEGIFLIEVLGQTQTNRVRREDYKAALRLERKFEEIYSSAGYNVQRIVPARVSERTDRILELLVSKPKLLKAYTLPLEIDHLFFPFKWF